MSEPGFELGSTYVHLGLGSRAVPLPDFTWTSECLDDYQRRFAADGDDGRLVCLIPQERTWETWERHPAGEELVVALRGRFDLIQERDGESHVVTLVGGQAAVNPRGVWHTVTVHEPGTALFVTPGFGTEQRPR